MKPLAVLAVLALSGCATTGGLTTVKVPIAIACNQQVPPRPDMPTEQFQTEPSLDEFVQGALAEIERREGYEIELREALIACTRVTQ